MALPKIPINMKALAKAGQVFESESQSDAVIEVLVDSSARRELVTLCRRVLKVRPGALELNISSVGTEMPKLNKDAGLIIVVAGDSPCMRRIMEVALWSDMKCVVLSEDAVGLVAKVPEEDAMDIAKTIIEVDTGAPQEDLERDLARWCIANLSELRLSLGAAFPFMRRVIAADLTRQTALENGVVAAVFFLPGPDLPILTLNQCKLLYQIAVVHEVPLTKERLVDVALVVVSAFGLRTLTRVALRKLAPIGWLVRGATALGATLALGHIAAGLYSRGGGIVEALQGKLRSSGPEPETTVLSTELPRPKAQAQSSQGRPAQAQGQVPLDPQAQSTGWGFPSPQTPQNGGAH